MLLYYSEADGKSKQSLLKWTVSDHDELGDKSTHTFNPSIPRVSIKNKDANGSMGEFRRFFFFAKPLIGHDVH